MAMVSQLNGFDVHIQEMHDSLATRACNKMAAAFLKSECDVMLIIDCDIIFRRKDIERMIGHIERGVPAVWGIYPKKHDETEPCLCTFNEKPEPDEHGLAEVRRSGRGFMMVARSVFEALKEENGGPALRYHNHGELQWDFFPVGVATGTSSALGGGNDPDGFPVREYLSEDWLFCDRLREHLGIKTLVDTGIALGHIGGKTYRFSDAQVQRID